ncbi:MAG: tetratricopeptide repeat protein, partial [Flavobacteriaceae bacterium]|nr:tetratricopeptide repeat protein [Flavobacteriaceae bacterium]
NEFTRPRFLLKAGITAMELGDLDQAIKHFEALTTEFPEASEATKATLYASRAQAMK